MRGRKGGARIGNDRNKCSTCNNFAANVARLARRELVDHHFEEYSVIALRVELDLYPQVIEDFVASHPEAFTT